MHADLSSIDLENIDYDDVLQMHRGWRRSEIALKKTTDELNALKIKSHSLSESHAKFLSQIQSLEYVKDYTISLQAQLNLVRQENASFKKENSQLIESKSRIEQLLKDIEGTEITRERSVREAQSEAEITRERYHEVAVSHKELEMMLSNEIALRTSTESRLVICDEVIDSLQAENSSIRLKLDSTLIRMNQCDQELAYASLQLSNLAEEVVRVTESKEQKPTSDAEVEVLKGDISRLLKLMEHYPASREFLNRWYDSDGMSFMGTGFSTGKASGSYSTPSGHEDRVNFNDFIDTAAVDYLDISPVEFNRIKKLRGVDSSPMTADFEEESEFWVPRKAAQAGLRFLAKKIPHAPPKVITEFLTNINKVWLRRERRRVRDVKAFYEQRVRDLKRRLSQQKSYRGVIAETDIRRLRNQVHDEHLKVMKGRARRPAEHSWENYFEELDDVDSSAYLKARTGWRLCENVLQKGHRRGGSIVSVAKEKLLMASLQSLETLGRQTRSHSEGGKDRSRSIDRVGNEDGTFPSEPYLRGALWLGRNLSMVIEELAENLDSHRSKFLNEVSIASGDQDTLRSRGHLSRLAVSSVDEAISLTNRSRVRAKEILKSVSRLSVGDLMSFQDLLLSMPIESTLQPSFSAGRRTTHLDRGLSSVSRDRDRDGKMDRPSSRSSGGDRDRGSDMDTLSSRDRERDRDRDRDVDRNRGTPSSRSSDRERYKGRDRGGGTPSSRSSDDRDRNRDRRGASPSPGRTMIHFT